MASLDCASPRLGSLPGKKLMTLSSLPNGRYPPSLEAAGGACQVTIALAANRARRQRRGLALATRSAMKRGCAKAATWGSGVQYFVVKPPALRERAAMVLAGVTRSALLSLAKPIAMWPPT